MQQSVLQCHIDLTPRTKCFKYVKYSLIASLIILIIMALIILIVAETKSKEKTSLTLGIISLVFKKIFSIIFLSTFFATISMTKNNVQKFAEKIINLCKTKLEFNFFHKFFIYLKFLVYFCITFIILIKISKLAKKI